jgi:DNA-binding GntR family transcriptional regulator
MLRDLAVCQKIYEHPKPELRERGIGYQQRLVEALRGRDGETAAQVLDAHMRYAEKTMLEQEAELEKAFL